MTEILTETIGEDGIAELCLNRPGKKNALNEEMFEALAATGERLKDHAGLRAVILTGAGGDFCSGLDLETLQSFAGNLEAMRTRLVTPLPGGRANWFQKPCTIWAELPVPVIAAVEGVCLGGGLQLALGADIRIARPDARLSIREAHWGMIPDMGISQSLPRLMRADQAMELMMTARILPGEEARALGLVTRTADDPLSDARDLARTLCARSPDALAGIKDLVARVWSLPPGEGLQIEAAIQAPIIGGANQIEAVMAGFQKRAPKFG